MGPTGTVARPEVRDWLSLIRFSHTIFALPFALIAVLFATSGRPPVRVLTLCVLAMVAARTAAMAYNRYVDRAIDARNPRTRGRELPRGAIRPGAALALALGAAAAFVVCAFLLAPTCGWLSLPVLVILLGYSHAKRFTSLCHLWLGVALGLAAPAAWVAARGAIDATIAAPLVLGLGVTFWVAGFDVLYACQDLEFDRAEGLFSLPARLGPVRALSIARGLHAIAAILFALFGLAVGAGFCWYLGVAAAGLLLVHEHRLVRADDLSRIDLAFFTLNGAVGLAMLAVAVADLWLC